VIFEAGGIERRTIRARRAQSSIKTQREEPS
jgi:hypothetical protein